jgi:hypothetical protein
MDVLWFRVSAARVASRPARFDGGRIFVAMSRRHCNAPMSSPRHARKSAPRLPAFATASPRGAVPRRPRRQIAGWDDVKLLIVAVDRLPVWHRPTPCIGDAAHAMPRSAASA